MGANDVLQRVFGGWTSVSCLDLDGLCSRSTAIVGALHATALAFLSVPQHAALSQTLAAAAAARVADVLTAFHPHAADLTDSAQYICSWTWRSTLNDIDATRRAAT